jgi:hypothetical protein
VNDRSAIGATGRIDHAKAASAITVYLDIPRLLLNDAANELFLSAGLGADRILTTALADSLTLYLHFA